MKLPGFFRMASITAQEAENMRIKVGAVISKSGNLIATGHNQRKSHPSITTHYMHAEAAAILSRRWDGGLRNCIIWVFRQRADGTPAISKPCPDCMKMIRESGIKRVYYTTGEAPYWEVLNI